MPLTDKKQLNILVVSSDMPSHVYATAKLAKILASENHKVTLVAPEGPALESARIEVNGVANIETVSAGPVATVKHANVRPVEDPTAWSVFWNAFRQGFHLPSVFNNIFDQQDGMFEPLCELIPNFDVVIPIHDTAATSCDAVEASTDGEVPCILFHSLPYDPLTYLDELEAWNHPRSITYFPHVGTYSANPPLRTLYDWFRYGIQLFWMALDTFLMHVAWSRSLSHHNRRRAARGLPRMYDHAAQFRGYLKKYPGITMGGVYPFVPAGEALSSNVVAAGALDTPDESLTPFTEDLEDWIERVGGDGIVYAAFGTGTTLNDREVAAVTGDLALELDNMVVATPPILLALRKSEQVRLRNAMDASVGAGPTREGDGFLEYMDGALRIQDNVPQVTLLNSGKVRVFINHFGFGNYSEGVSAGVPMIAYPSGFDQIYNAARAIEAGIALPVQPELVDLTAVVMRALDDESLLAQARAVSEDFNKYDGESRAIAFVEKIAEEGGNVEAEPKLSKKVEFDVPDSAWMSGSWIVPPQESCMTSSNELIRRGSSAGAA